MRFIKKNKQSGLSLIEIIIALGIFSIIMVGLVSLASLAYLNESSKRDLAFLENFIKEGESAVKSIADSGWNNLVFQQTGVEFNGESWVFKGENTQDIYDKFSRTIFLDDVWRNDAGEIVGAADSGAGLDIETKNISIFISWSNGLAEKSISRKFYLTNWRSKEFEQSDWSGGGEQEIWLEEDKFLDSENIDFSKNFEIKLAQKTNELGESEYYQQGFLESSAFYRGDNQASWNFVLLTANLDDCQPGCDAKAQVAFADDNEGQPGVWGQWLGPEGAESYFVPGEKVLIPFTNNGKSWIKYKVELLGSAESTPIFYKIIINYQ